jgi:hypothetical protein
MNDTDARLCDPWLRINRVLRLMLHTRWSAKCVGVSTRQLADGCLGFCIIGMMAAKVLLGGSPCAVLKANKS